MSECLVSCKKQLANNTFPKPGWMSNTQTFLYFYFSLLFKSVQTYSVRLLLTFKPQRSDGEANRDLVQQ